MIELLKILAALAAMQQGPSPVHLVADQPIKIERLEAEKPVFVPAGRENECITPEIVKMVGNYFLPGIVATDNLKDLDAIDASHPKAPGYRFHVDFKNGCATRFEVKKQ